MVTLNSRASAEKKLLGPCMLCMARAMAGWSRLFCRKSTLAPFFPFSLNCVLYFLLHLLLVSSGGASTDNQVSMSSSVDPQTWVFPPLGAAVLPSDVSAAFGPISQGDRIKLEWAPASSTPEIAFICANGSSTNQVSQLLPLTDLADGTTYGASDGSTSPYYLEFDQTINNGSSHTCWFFFPGTTLGNTLTFTYNNDGTGSSVLWEQDSQLAQALSGGGGSAATTTIVSTETVTVTESISGSDTTIIGTGPAAAAATTYTFTETFTETITQTPSTLLTTITNAGTTFVSTSVALLAQNTDSASPSSTSNTNISPSSASGLSVGAAAGITAAAIIAFALLLLLLGWLLYSRRSKKKKNTQNGGSNGNLGYAGTGVGSGPGPGVDVGPVLMPSTYKQQQQMQQMQDQPLMQGYYQPGPSSASAPRRTIHEIGDGR